MTDEAMRAKEYLDQYRDAVSMVRNLKGQARQLELLAEGTGMDVTEERSGSNSVSDPTGEIGTKLADIYQDVMDAADKAMDVLMDVSRVINAVDDPAGSRLLHLRFIELRTWEVIAEEMCISLRHIFRVRNRALESAYHVIECHN